MRHISKPIVFVCFLLLLSNLCAQQGGFEEASFDHQGKTLHYRILKPTGFDASKKYPLHLFLHGSGERGDDNKAQLIHGGSLFKEQNDSYPAIVIFPQCPEEDYWAQVRYSRDSQSGENVFDFPENNEPGWALSAVIALMDTMTSESYVDTSRVYVGGLSMGGMGTFELLSLRPDMFAAATIICGGGNINNTKKWAHKVPVWIFHGTDDPTVSSRYSKLMVEALLQQGVEPRFSLYPGVDHLSWNNAFAEPDFFKWVYSKKKEMTPDCTPEWLKFSEATLIGKYQEQNAVQKTKDNSQSLVFMGDSITEGWLEASPEFWQEHSEFINRGVSGHTTSQMLVRFRQDVIALKPKGVIILAGTNDIAGNTGTTSLETIASNIFSMADIATQNGIEVTIASVLPAYDYPWKTGLEPANKIVRLNKMLLAFAKENNHNYLDYHSAMKDARDGLQEAYTYDMVHCTKAGYKKMEEVLLQNVSKQ